MAEDPKSAMEAARRSAEAMKRFVVEIAVDAENACTRMAAAVGQHVKQAFTAVAEAAKKAIREVGTVADAAANEVKSLAARAAIAAAEGASRAVSGIKGAVDAAITAVRRAASEALSAVENAATRAVEAVRKTLQRSADAVEDTLTNLATRTGSTIERAVAEVQKAGERMLDRTSRAATSATQEVERASKQLVDSTGDAVESATKQVERGNRRVVESTANALEDAAKRVQHGNQRLVDRTSDAVESAAKQVEKANRRIVEGTSRAADASARDVASASRRSAKAAADAADLAADAMTREARRGATEVERAYTTAFRRVRTEGKGAADAVSKGAGGGGKDDERKDLKIGEMRGRGVRGTISAVAGDLMNKVTSHPVVDVVKRAAVAVAAFGAAAVAAASKSQAAWNGLGMSMRKAGTDLSSKQVELNNRVKEFTSNTTHSSNEYVEALTRMIDTTGDYDSSVRNMSLAADVAAKRHIDLNTAAELVGKVAQGNSAALKELGIKSESAQDGLDALKKECDGFAAGTANTFQGKLTQLNNAWGDFKVAVGNAMIQAGGGTSILDTLRGVLVSVTDAFTRHKEIISAWVQVVMGGISFQVTWLTSLVRIVWNVAQGIYYLLQTIGNGVEYLVTASVNTAIKGINFLIEAANKVPGVDISPLQTMDAAVEASRAKLGQSWESLKQQGADLGDTFGNIADSAVAQYERVRGAIDATRSRRPPQMDDTPTVAPPRPGPQDSKDPPPVAIANASASASSSAGATATAEVGTPPAPEAPAEPPVDEFDKRIAALAEMAQLGTITAAELEDALSLQMQINAALDKENLTHEERVLWANRFNALQPVNQLRQQNQQLDDEIKKLEQLTRLGRARKEDVERARDMEKQLTEQLRTQAMTAERRRQTEAQIARLQAVREPGSGFTAKNVFAAMQAGAEKAGEAIQQSFGQAFEMLGRDITNTSAAFDALWAGIKKGVGEAVAEEARVHAKKEFASAIGATAKGLSYAASMNFPAAASSFASAAQHMAAGAAWSVLAGAASAAGGGGAAAGGGSGAPRESRDAGSNVAQQAEKRGPSIHVYVDGIDPSNPRHQKLTQETMKGVRERYGTDSSVTYGSRRAS